MTNSDILIRDAKDLIDKLRQHQNNTQIRTQKLIQRVTEAEKALEDLETEMST